MYVQMSWPRFLLALGVVSLPAALLEHGEQRWAWRYVALILVMMIVTNWRGVSAFSGFVQRELRRA